MPFSRALTRGEYKSYSRKTPLLNSEGTLHGTCNEMINSNGASAPQTPELPMAHLDKLGGQESYNHYAAGWAHAIDTPYPWTKQVASSCLAGGCRPHRHGTAVSRVATACFF